MGYNSIRIDYLNKNHEVLLQRTGRDMPENIYIELTKRFNEKGLRAVLSSGQAVVLYGLAIMSKDGDWILRETEETMTHILTVLEEYGGKYRFGAPLDTGWMGGGWSAHFEFNFDGLRVRTDFVTRPPRISEQELQHIWDENRENDIPLIGLNQLAEIKKTNREKDYVILGELAREMDDPKDQLLYSRSARDIIVLAAENPGLIAELVSVRPLLKRVDEGREALEQALDSERRELMHKNEERLKTYMDAAERWADEWLSLKKEIADSPLEKAHEKILKRAEALLPKDPLGMQKHD